jgi:hypothetical protein
MAVYAASSPTDIVSIALAGAAFAVSSMTLWLTVLRRPRIEIDRVPHPDPSVPHLDPMELKPGRDWADRGLAGADYYPHKAEAKIVVFVANTGAGGTVVERIATDHHEDGAGERVFGNVSAVPAVENFKLPLPVARGDSRVGVLVCEFVVNLEPLIRESEEERQAGETRQRAAEDLTAEEDRAARERNAREQILENAKGFAERLQALRSLSVTLTWTYRRPRLPWQRSEASTKGKGNRVIQFEPEVVDKFREACCQRWILSDQTKHLAVIARERPVSKT